MRSHLHEKFDASELPSKVFLWADIWCEFLDSYLNQKKKGTRKFDVSIHDTDYDFDLITPHTLVLLLKDEIQFNGLRNKLVHEVIKAGFERFFTIPNRVNKDKSLSSTLYLPFHQLPAFRTLGDWLNKPEGSHEILSAVRGILPFFETREYACWLVEELYTVLFESNACPDEVYPRIKSLVNLVIGEFLLMGYSPEWLIKLPDSLFSHIFTFGDHVSWDFPHKISWREFDDQGLMPEYNARIRERSLSITLKERFMEQVELFKCKAQTYNVLFGIQGASISSSISIDNWEIYNPGQICKIKWDKSLSNKINQNESEILCPYGVNICVKIEAFDTQKAVELAAEVAEKSINVISSKFITPNPIILKTDITFVLDDSFRLIASFGGAAPTSPEALQNMASIHNVSLDKLSVNSDPYPALAGTWETNNSNNTSISEKQSKLAVALKWQRKSDFAQYAEDRLLGYWVILEKIFTFNSASESNASSDLSSNNRQQTILRWLPAISSYYKAHGLVKACHKYTQKLRSSSHSSKEGMKPLFAAPENFIRKFYFPNYWEKHIKKELCFNYTEFLQELKQILPDIPDTITRKRCQDCCDFYHDRTIAENSLRTWQTNAKNDLSMIYRYRNSIVHNAHFEPNLIGVYTLKARNFAKLATDIISRNDPTTSNLSVEELLHDKVWKFELMCRQLKDKTPVQDMAYMQSWQT